MSKNRPGTKALVKNYQESLKSPKQKPVKVPPRNKSLSKRDKNDARTDRSTSRDRSSSSSSSRSGPLLGGKGKVAARARRLTNGVIRSEVRDLKGQRKEINRAADNANALTDTNYQRGVGDLNHVNTEVTEFLSNMGSQNQQMFDTTKMQQEAANAALQKQIGGTYDSAGQQVSGELGALGLSGDFLQQLGSDKASAQSQAAIGGSNAMSNLGLANQNSSQMQNLLGGMAQGSFLSNIGQNLNARNDANAETGQERMDQMSLVREAIADAKGSRKDVFFELLNQLEQSGWGSKSSSSSRGSSNGGGGNGNPSPGGNQMQGSKKASDDEKPAGSKVRQGAAVAMSQKEFKKYQTRGKKAVAMDSKELRRHNR